MASERPDLGLEEYRALRATIRERGTARVLVTTITFVSWSALSMAACTLFVIPAVGFIPLLVLAAGFEAVFALHVGVERVGRYIQVRYETTDNLPGWEHAAMRLGAHPGSSGGVDPLFAWPFLVAALLNLMVVLFMNGGDASIPLALGVYTLPHAVFLARVLFARRFARRQRSEDTKALGG